MNIREHALQESDKESIDSYIRSWIGKKVQLYGPDAVHLSTGFLKYYDGHRVILVTESENDWHVFPCRWVSIRRVEESGEE